MNEPNRGPFRDLFNLTERVDPKVLTKRHSGDTDQSRRPWTALPGTRAQQISACRASGAVSPDPSERQSTWTEEPVRRR
jgi:hypothetical protein